MKSKCTGCGTCAEKCPTVTSDAYNLGLGKAKAIYKYFAQGIPSAYTIDANGVPATSSRARNAVSAPRSARPGPSITRWRKRSSSSRSGPLSWPPATTCSMLAKSLSTATDDLPNVVTALEFERFLSASGPTHGHVYRRSDLAVMETLPEVEKNQQKAAKGLERYRKAFRHGFR